MVSHKLSSYLEEKGIRHIHTAFNNPAANGGVERLNQSLKNGNRAHLTQGCTFNTSLLQTLLHYHATPHATTGVSPASLMLGRELQLPLDRLRPALTQAPAHPVQASQHTSEPDEPLQPDTTRQASCYWLGQDPTTSPPQFRLIDGTGWHARRLHKVQAPLGPGLGASAVPYWPHSLNPQHPQSLCSSIPQPLLSS